MVVKPEKRRKGRKKSGLISNASVLFVMIVPNMSPNIDAVQHITTAPPTC